jgi:hypothetical protein
MREIPPIKIPERDLDKQPKERESLKSSRRSSRDVREEPKKEEEPPVIIWTCDVCQRPNNFADGGSCQYTNGREPCGGNLELMENFETKEMSQSEYKTCLEAWEKTKQEESKKEESQIQEDDWECLKCNTVNKMDKKDIYSAICKKCKTKNELIEQMIKLANENETLKQTELEMEYYKKNKNGELDRRHAQNQSQQYDNRATGQTASGRDAQDRYNQHVSSTKPRPGQQVVPQRQQINDDEQYHKRGPYYQCKMCDEYAVHESDDKVCLNTRCKSNIMK